MMADPRARARRVGGLVLSLAWLAAASACAGEAQGLTWAGPSADPSIITIAPASFATSSGVTDAVLAECGLERSIPEWIARNTPVPVALSNDPTNGARVLYLQVTQILAPGGGMWSGPKQITLHGDLVHGGATIASFDARRTTVTGGRSHHGGTCAVLDYIAESLAKDVRDWLASPTQGAQLGEL